MVKLFLINVIREYSNFVDTFRQVQQELDLRLAIEKRRAQQSKKELSGLMNSNSSPEGQVADCKEYSTEKL